jgi:hypothetical protein
MRGENLFVPFLSRDVYDNAGTVYANVAGEGDFPREYFSELFMGHENLLSQPQKNTVLHEIILHILGFYSDYWIDKFPDDQFRYLQKHLPAFGIKLPRWFFEAELGNHEGDLYALPRRLHKKLLPSIFYILFSDRTFLTLFQSRAAEHVKTLKKQDHPSLMAADDVFMRPKYLPTWLKNGVFHRDRGRCQCCKKDLTGLLRPANDIHLDHIVPLAKSGSNDPTNFQLLCSKCNLSKSKNTRDFETMFAPYWN